MRPPYAGASRVRFKGLAGIGPLSRTGFEDRVAPLRGGFNTGGGHRCQRDTGARFRRSAVVRYPAPSTPMIDTSKPAPARPPRPTLFEVLRDAPVTAGIFIVCIAV